MTWEVLSSFLISEVYLRLLLLQPLNMEAFSNKTKWFCGLHSGTFKRFNFFDK